MLQYVLLFLGTPPSPSRDYIILAKQYVIGMLHAANDLRTQISMLSIYVSKSNSTYSEHSQLRQPQNFNRKSWDLRLSQVIFCGGGEGGWRDSFVKSTAIYKLTHNHLLKACLKG